MYLSLQNHSVASHSLKFEFFTMVYFLYYLDFIFLPSFILSHFFFFFYIKTLPTMLNLLPWILSLQIFNSFSLAETLPFSWLTNYTRLCTKLSSSLEAHAWCLLRTLPLPVLHFYFQDVIQRAQDLDWGWKGQGLIPNLL